MAYLIIVSNDLFFFQNFAHHKFTAQAKLQKEESSNTGSHDHTVEPIKQESCQEPLEVKRYGLGPQHFGDVICQSIESSDKLMDTEEILPQDRVLDDITKEKPETGQQREGVVQKSTKIQFDNLEGNVHAEELRSEGMVIDDTNKDRSSTGQLGDFVHASTEEFENLEDSAGSGIFQSHEIVIGDTSKNSVRTSEVNEDVIQNSAKSPFDNVEDATHADKLKAHEMVINETIKERLGTCKVEEDFVCKLDKSTPHKLDNTALTDKLPSQGIVINNTTKESASTISVEHTTLPLNETPAESNRTKAQVGVNLSDDLDRTNDPGDEKPVEYHEKGSLVCSGKAQESDTGKGTIGMEKSSCPVESDGVLGQDQDEETSPKKDGNKTGKQNEDQGCLVQLFTGESV